MDQEVTPLQKTPGISNTTAFGIIFTLAGALMLYFFGLPSLKYAYESRSWPATSGIITKSEVDSWMKDGKTHYGTVIRYTYHVEGKEHISYQLGVNNSRSDYNMSAAKDLVQEYPVGTSVEVYYDPEFPESAALKPGVRTGDIALAGGMLMFLILGLLLLFRIIKPTRSYGHTPSRGGSIDISRLLKR